MKKLLNWGKTKKTILFKKAPFYWDSKFLLRNTSCYPLLLNPDKDDAILKMTEGRVPCVNHEVVPDYFRTKPDPAVEAREKKMEEEANKESSKF